MRERSLKSFAEPKIIKKQCITKQELSMSETSSSDEEPEKVIEKKTVLCTLCGTTTENTISKHCGTCLDWRNDYSVINLYIMIIGNMFYSFYTS